MTEISYLWNGTTVGDAVDVAPYVAYYFNQYLFMPQLLNDTDNAYIVPGYLNDLRVTPVGTGVLGVNIAAGAAVINNFIYINTDNIGLSIDKATSDYGRYDYAVLRYDRVYQKIRLAIVKGPESDDISTPRTLPTLTQDAFIWEIPLARILVDGTEISTGYDYIFDGAVHDQRKFLPPKANIDYRTVDNLIRNSEFMAFHKVDTAPEYWSYTGTSLDSWNSSFDQMSRGRATSFFDLLETTAYIKPDVYVYTLRALWRTSSAYTSPLIISIKAIQKSGVETLVHTIYLQDINSSDASIRELCETFTIPTTLDDVVALNIEFLADDSLGAAVGQCILVAGYFPGPFRQFHEIIPLTNPITDAAWSNTAKSSGTTTINLGASFLGTLSTTDAILHGTKGLLLKLVGRDSASGATATITLAIRGYAAPYNTDYLILEVGNITNDTYRERFGILPIDQPAFAAHLTAPQFRAVVVASGANTFDATIEIIGIIT